MLSKKSFSWVFSFCPSQPQNILLTSQLPPGDIKIVDFGLARRLGAVGELREILGTPEYVGKMAFLKQTLQRQNHVVVFLTDQCHSTVVAGLCIFYVYIDSYLSRWIPLNHQVKKQSTGLGLKTWQIIVATVNDVSPSNPILLFLLTNTNHPHVLLHYRHEPSLSLWSSSGPLSC